MPVDLHPGLAVNLQPILRSIHREAHHIVAAIMDLDLNHFFSIQQVSHFPVSEDRILYGSLTIQKRLQAWLLFSAMKALQENILD